MLLPRCRTFLQLAALHAAQHGWPAHTLIVLLQHMVAAYRLELLQLLTVPLAVALEAHLHCTPRRRRGAADALATAQAMLHVLQQDAVVERPELLARPLLLLALLVCCVCACTVRVYNVCSLVYVSAVAAVYDCVVHR